MLFLQASHEPVLQKPCSICKEVFQAQDQVMTIEHAHTAIPPCTFHKQCLFAFLLLHDLQTPDAVSCPCGNNVSSSQMMRLRNSFVAEAYGIHAISDNPTQDEQRILNERWQELIQVAQAQIEQQEKSGAPLMASKYGAKEPDMGLDDKESKGSDDHTGILLGSGILLLFVGALITSAISNVS